jgi:hypothetical protein
MGKWTGLTKPITAAAAEAERIEDRIFGSSYEARQRQHAAGRQSQGINRASYRPWKKPTIERVKR